MQHEVLFCEGQVHVGRIGQDASVSRREFECLCKEFHEKTLNYGGPVVEYFVIDIWPHVISEDY